MKKLFYLFIALAIGISTATAKRDKIPANKVTSKMKSAAKKYAKILIKEIPSETNGLSSRSKARDAIVSKLEKEGLLTVDGNTQKLLKKRKEVVRFYDLH